MKQEIDDALKQWGRLRKAELADSNEDAVRNTMRTIAARTQHSRRGHRELAWLIRLIPAAAALACLVVASSLLQLTTSGGTVELVYEVPCLVTPQVDVPDEPLLPVSRYETLFREN